MEKKRIKRMPIKTIYCDVDDTLWMWSSNQYYKESESIEIEFMNYTVKVSPNDSNIAKLKEFYNKGYEVVVWSATGQEWASLAVKKLGLENFVDYCLGKPDFYIDDLSVNQFMISEQRLWSKPSGFKD